MNRENELKRLAANIKKSRLDKNISQEKLAELCDFDRTYISMLERAKRNPSYLNLLKLANGLEIDICILFQDQGEDK
ncbi:helix-turn-helix domain-containing protein [Hydrogenimonas sp.]